MDAQAIEKQLRFLRYYAAMATIAIFTLGFFQLFATSRGMRELTVECINVVDAQGNIQVQLAGSYPPRRTELAGLLFHNQDGSEAGGLVYSGQKKDGQVTAASVLTMDQYNNDQIVVLRYEEENGRRNHGLWIADRPDTLGPEVLRAFSILDTIPEGPARDAVVAELFAAVPPEQLVARRLFVGRDKEKAARIELSDRRGTPRLVLQVDSLGAAHISFLDAGGKVVHTIPE